jgi:hypothetical protein
VLELLVPVVQARVLARQVSVNDRQQPVVSSVPVVLVHDQAPERAVSVRPALVELPELPALTSAPTAPPVVVALVVAVAPVAALPVLSVAVAERARRASPSAPREQNSNSEKPHHLVASAFPVAMARR